MDYILANLCLFSFDHLFCLCDSLGNTCELAKDFAVDGCLLASQSIKVVVKWFGVLAVKWKLERPLRLHVHGMHFVTEVCLLEFA